MKDLGSYSDYTKEYNMTTAYKPKYLIYVMTQNGADDFDWEIQDEVDTLSEATSLLMHLDNAGYRAKMFDPYVGVEYEPHEIDM